MRRRRTRTTRAIAGKSVKQARTAVVERLRETGALEGEPRPIQHSVKYYEKGDRPLEFVTTRQWFVRLLDKKDALLAKGDEVRWHPDFMRLRFRDWTENLNSDWCVSRQRYFGVQIPVWYPLDADGRRDYARPIVAAGDDAARRPDDRRPAGLHGGAARPAGRLQRRDRRLRHLVHQLADAADQLALAARPGAPRTALPRRHPPAEPRDHPHLGVLHDRQGAAAREHDPVAARGRLGVDPRSRPQEDVEEQGQRRHADRT